MALQFLQLMNETKYTVCVCQLFSFCYLLASIHRENFSLKNSKRVLTNLYKCLTITTHRCFDINNNNLRLLTNMFRSTFLIFETHRERPRMLTNTYEYISIIENWRRIASVSPFTTIYA